MDYIIIDNYKIVIDYENDNQYVLDKDNKKVSLLDSDNLLREIFNDDNDGIFYDDLLISIIKDNKNFNEENEFLIPLFEFVLKVIPLEHRSSFYKNLSTLRIEFDLNDLGHESYNELEMPYYIGYDKNNMDNMNKVVIPRNFLEFIYNDCKYHNNSSEYFNVRFNFALLHELFHVASSKLDMETMIFDCGFYTSDEDNKLRKNRGFTEGFTNLLTEQSLSKFIDKGIGYPIETRIASQIEILVGRDVLINSYFGNKGITDIMEELNDIYNDQTLGRVLFAKIEDNYKLGCFAKRNNKKFSQTILASIQLVSVFYLENKVNKLRRNGLKEEANALLERFASRLITPDFLKEREIDNSIYIGLDKSINNFNSLLEDNSTLLR